MDKERAYTVSTVKKAVALLKLFTNKDREFTLTELSIASGFDKSTTFRLMYTLNSEGFVDYDEKSKKYSLGIELYHLGQLKYSDIDIRKIARKHLQSICDQHNLASYVGFRRGDYLVMVDQIFPTIIPFWAQLFALENFRELYSTGIGRLFLAQDSDEEIDAYFSRIKPKAITNNTIIDVNELLALIHRARIDHYSGNLAENEDSIYSLCVPIYNNQKMEAGISLCGPKNIIWGKNFETLLEELQTISRRISYEMGYN